MSSRSATQALAECGDLDQARRGGGLLHAATSSIVGGLRGRIMRDTAARISAESLVAHLHLRAEGYA